MVKKEKTLKRSSAYGKYYKQKIKDPDGTHPSNKSGNRRARVYQRKRRVAGKPKKIYRRFKKIINTIHNDPLRTKVVKDIVSCGDLDTFQRAYRGKLEDFEEIAADTIDLLREVVDMVDKNVFHFKKKCTSEINLKVNDADVTIPWPIDIADGDVVDCFLDDYLLVYNGKIYHNEYHIISFPEDFGYDFVAMCKWTVDKKLQLTEYLDRFGINIAELKNECQLQNLR